MKGLPEKHIEYVEHRLEYWRLGGEWVCLSKRLAEYLTQKNADPKLILKTSKRLDKIQDTITKIPKNNYGRMSRAFTAINDAVEQEEERIYDS